MRKGASRTSEKGNRPKKNTRFEIQGESSHFLWQTQRRGGEKDRKKRNTKLESSCTQGSSGNKKGRRDEKKGKKAGEGGKIRKKNFRKMLDEAGDTNQFIL